MTTLGLPPEMFWVFVATIVAGSLGAIHYVVAHIILGRPFAEIPPPVLREGGLPEPGGGAGAGSEGSGGAGGSGSGLDSEGSGGAGDSGPGSEGSGGAGSEGSVPGDGRGAQDAEDGRG